MKCIVCLHNQPDNFGRFCGQCGVKQPPKPPPQPPQPLTNKNTNTPTHQHTWHKPRLQHPFRLSTFKHLPHNAHIVDKQPSPPPIPRKIELQNLTTKPPLLLPRQLQVCVSLVYCLEDLHVRGGENRPYVHTCGIYLLSDERFRPNSQLWE